MGLRPYNRAIAELQVTVKRPSAYPSTGHQLEPYRVRLRSDPLCARYACDGPPAVWLDPYQVKRPGPVPGAGRDAMGPRGVIHGDPACRIGPKNSEQCGWHCVATYGYLRVVGMWWALLVEASLDDLKGREDVVLPADSSGVGDGGWVRIDVPEAEGLIVEEGRVDPASGDYSFVSAVSRQLGIPTALCVGHTVSGWLQYSRFEGGKCVRVFDSGDGEWSQVGEAEQPWEVAFAEQRWRTPSELEKGSPFGSVLFGGRAVTVVMDEDDKSSVGHRSTRTEPDSRRLSLPFSEERGVVLGGLVVMAVGAFLLWLGLGWGLPFPVVWWKKILPLGAGTLTLAAGIRWFALAFLPTRGHLVLADDGVYERTRKSSRYHPFSLLQAGPPMSPRSLALGGASKDQIDRFRRRLWVRARAASRRDGSQRDLSPLDAHACDGLADAAEGWNERGVLMVPWGVATGSHTSVAFEVVGVGEQAARYGPNGCLYLSGFRVDDASPARDAQVEVIDLELLRRDPSPRGARPSRSR